MFQRVNNPDYIIVGKKDDFYIPCIETQISSSGKSDKMSIDDYFR